MRRPHGLDGRGAATGPMIRISGRAIARLVALIAGADFLGDDFGQREANDFRGAKGNCLKKLRSHWSRRSVASVDVSRRLICRLTSLSPLLFHTWLRVGLTPQTGRLASRSSCRPKW